MLVAVREVHFFRCVGFTNKGDHRFDHVADDSVQWQLPPARAQEVPFAVLQDPSIAADIAGPVPGTLPTASWSPQAAPQKAPNAAPVVAPQVAPLAAPEAVSASAPDPWQSWGSPVAPAGTGGSGDGHSGPSPQAMSDPWTTWMGAFVAEVRGEVANCKVGGAVGGSSAAAGYAVYDPWEDRAPAQAGPGKSQESVVAQAWTMRQVPAAMPPSAPAPPPAPPAVWPEYIYVDQATGIRRPYYANCVSGVVQWEPPADFAVQTPQHVPACAATSVPDAGADLCPMSQISPSGERWRVACGKREGWGHLDSQKHKSRAAWWAGQPLDSRRAWAVYTMSKW